LVLFEGYIVEKKKNKNKNNKKGEGERTRETKRKERSSVLFSVFRVFYLYFDFLTPRKEDAMKESLTGVIYIIQKKGGGSSLSFFLFLHFEKP